jgi:hypothetical protein
MKITSLLNPKILSAVIVLTAASTPAFADGTIFLEVGNPAVPGGGFGESNPYQFADGGEFTALTTGLTIPLTPGTVAPAGYASVATFKVGSITGFETFCIEDQVDFFVGTTYNYSIGTPGVGAGAVLQQSTAGIKSLTAGAAWLYEQFATGKLAGYDYNTGNDPADAAARLADAGVLQATLWALQDEPADSNVPYVADPTLNFALKDLDSQFGSFANSQVTANASYGVSVLELTTTDGKTLAQDQLIYWGSPSVPDTATTALLVGGSLVAMAAFSRRLRTASVK